MRAVNLLPQTGRRAPGFRGGKGPLLALGAVAAVAAVGYWGWSSHQAVGDAERDVAAAVAERDDLQRRLGAFQQADAREAEQRLRQGAIVGLAAGRVNWERLVRELATVMPRDTWLTNLRGEADDPATVAAAATAAGPNAAAPRGVRLDGFAYNQRRVAQLMARADAVPGLGEPRLTTSEVQARGDRKVIHFVIDIPIDQRAQDRPTLTPVSAAAPTPGATQ